MHILILKNKEKYIELIRCKKVCMTYKPVPVRSTEHLCDWSNSIWMTDRRIIPAWLVFQLLINRLHLLLDDGHAGCIHKYLILCSLSTNKNISSPLSHMTDQLIGLNIRECVQLFIGNPASATKHQLSDGTCHPSRECQISSHSG